MMRDAWEKTKKREPEKGEKDGKRKTRKYEFERLSSIMRRKIKKKVK